MASLRDVAAAASWTTLSGLLPPPPRRVLEVGCGRGHLAMVMQEAGYTVTGLEPDADAAAEARDSGVAVLAHGLLDHGDDEPYDIVLFTLSFHHIDALDEALAHAVRLTRPSGVLAFQEFGRERVDRAAAEFCFDTEAALASVLGLETESDATADPHARWHERHQQAPNEPLHGGGDVLTAIAAHADIRHLSETPMLWRLALQPIDEQAPDAAARVAPTLLAIERRRIAEGTLPATGFVVVATPR